MTAKVKIIAALLAFIALAGAVLGYGHWQYGKGVQHTTDRYEAANKAQQAEAATLLANETEKTRLLERALQAAKNQQELKDATNQKAVSDLAAMRASVGKLRDPYAAECGGSGGGTKGEALGTSGLSAADRAEGAGVLSPELADLLWTKFAEADVLNNAYASCRADAYTVREPLP